MRIVLVGPVHPLRGGIALHTAGMAIELKRREHWVRVVSYRRQYPALLFPGRTQIDPEPAPRGLDGLPIEPAIDSLDPFSWRRVGADLARFAPDVMVLQRWHPFFTPLLATIAAPVRRGGARIAWVVHNVRPHESSRVPWGPLLALGMQAQDLCLVHAASERDALVEIGVASESQVMPLPVLLPVEMEDPVAARSALGIAPDEAVFLFFGHVRRYKGVDVLLEALALLSQDGPPWRAIIAGEWYVDRAAADAKIALPPLAGRVRIDDRYLPRHVLARYFAAANVVVLPYRSGTQSAVVSQSHAYGRPVVSTRVGGLAEVVREGETGLLVDADSPSALAVALEEVRRGRAFSADAIARAASAASFAPLVDALEKSIRDH